MNRNRKRKNKNRRFSLFVIVTIALLVPVSVNFLYHNGGALNQFGERAAMLSAVISMPESSFDLLRERFIADLYDDAGITPVAPPVHTPAPAPSEPQQPAVTPDEPEQPVIIRPDIPEEYAAPLISENFSGIGNDKLLQFGAGRIRNDTSHEAADIEALFELPMQPLFEDTDGPQVLIYHTHATESFERYDSDIYDTRNTWRSTDNEINMVAVGDAMTRVLEENGIPVIHNVTQHDFPSYNGSYERSAITVSEYLEEYPSIKVVLDLHRDAMERDDGSIVKAVDVVDGKKAAQIMIISGCDDGTMNMPNWRQNFRFAIALQDYMESAYPGLTRPILFSYRKYNQNLSTGALLLEFGSNANTLEESVYSAELAGQALADLILDHME